jgi:hypothetical protein
LSWLETFIWNSLLNKQKKKRKTVYLSYLAGRWSLGPALLLSSLLGGPTSSAAAQLGAAA